MVRLVIGGHRVHHGLIGAVLGVVGAALAYHDRRDALCWVKDLRG